MAINATVYDLENYPENSKTVILDLLKAVPVGAEGDEKFLLTCKTSAYADVGATPKTTIDDIFVQEFLCGWAKSSGFKGAVFTIDGSCNTLKVKIDGAPTYSEITLTNGTNLTGDAVAADIQVQLRGIGATHSPSTTLDGNLGYVNCRCSFTNSRFIIKSGTISKLLSGTDVSSVKIDTTGTANQLLGFDFPVDSNLLAGTDIREVVTASPYTADTSPLSVSTGLDCVVGDSLYIESTTGVSDYFTVISGTMDTILHVTTSGVHGCGGIRHYYPTGSKVQKLRYNDPEYTPGSCLRSVDDALTWGILSLANQIDFSG